MPSKIEIEWDSAAPNSGLGTTHEALRGEIGQLPVGGESETCIGPGTTGTSVIDTTTPPSGKCYYYLVRGRNACGVGTYGFDSGLIERLSPACP